MFVSYQMCVAFEAFLSNLWHKSSLHALIIKRLPWTKMGLFREIDILKKHSM